MAQLVKTVNGLAIASVKAINGLAIASVKSVLGLDNTSGGGSPIAFAGLVTLSSGANSTTFNTTSYTPTANALVLAVVTTTGPDSATPPTYAGNGLTWVEVAGQLNALSNYRVTLFRAMGSSPSAGVGTVTAPTGNTSCSVRVVEFQNVKTSGINGADAVVQSGVNTATSTSPSVTLSALTGSDNAVFAAVLTYASNPLNITPDAGWTEDYDGGNITPTVGLATFYGLATTDNTPSGTISSAEWMMVALEISIP